MDPDPHYFDSEERTEASLAASRLVEALKALGIEELDNLDLEISCAHCCTVFETRISLGSYRPAELVEVAAKLEAVVHQLSEGTAAT